MEAKAAKNGGVKLVEYSKIASNISFSLKWVLLAVVSLAAAVCTPGLSQQAIQQTVTPTVSSTATATPEPAATLSTSPSPSATAISTQMLSPAPGPTLTPTSTTPLPTPLFYAAPTGTILAVQYRYLRPSEIPSYDDTSRPYYFPRDSVVWAIPAKGEPYRWLDDGRDKVQMQVSPDYSQVAYVVNSHYGKFTSIWVANADGSNPRQLTSDYPDDDLGGHVYLGGWSPDGQKLAYIFNYRKGWSGAALYVVDVSSEKVTEMNVERVYGAAWVNNWRLRVARDFEEIAEIDIYTQVITPITEPSPLIVPGGAVEYDHTKGSERITVYAADGSELYQLDLSGWPIWHSTISPDLKWFIINVFGKDTKTTTGIYKVSKDQPQPQLVLQGFGFTYETEIAKIYKDTNLDLSRVWSPDSRWFLILNFHTKKDGNELYAVNVETGEVKAVMEYEATGVDPMVWLK